MASLDDLKKRITSVKSTQKITKAMKMVAAAKLKRAQDSAEKGRPISTIFLIRSKITPTERETTVKAAIEKNKGGNNSKSIHLSNNGIIFHLLSTNF